MNPLDYVLIGVLVIFLITGYMKGFLAQVLQIVAIVASFILAGRYYTTLANASFFDGVRATNAAAASVISFLAIFFVSGAVLGFLASFFAKKFRSEHIKSGDRLLGSGLSLAKGVLILGGVGLGLQQWQNGRDINAELESDPASARAKVSGWIAGSQLVPHLSSACLSLVALVPDAQREQIKDYIAQHKDKLPAGLPTGASEKPGASQPDTGQPDTSGRPAGDSKSADGSLFGTVSKEALKRLVTGDPSNQAQGDAPPALDFSSLRQLRKGLVDAGLTGGAGRLQDGALRPASGQPGEAGLTGQ